MTKVHDKVSVNALCFAEASLAEAADIWRDIGPKRISFIGPHLLDSDIGAVRAMVKSGGYELETISYYFHAGPLSLQAAGWAEPRANLFRMIDRAAMFGARSIYMLTGGRGSLSWEDAVAVYSEAVAPCVAHAREAGISLAIENTLPLYADVHLGTCLRDSVAIVEAAGIGLCLDIFAGWTEAGLNTTITRALPRIVVVQVSDYILGDRAMPCRAVPGDGAIPLPRILGHLLTAGYQGNFDLELLGPRISREGPREAARRGAINVGDMLRALGE